MPWTPGFLQTKTHTCFPPPNKRSPVDSIFYIMLQVIVHIGGISCIYRQGSMDLVYLYYSCRESCMVSCGLCYNTIISNAIYHIKSVMKLYWMFYYDRHISIHINIFCINVCLQNCVIFGNKAGHVYMYLSQFVFLIAISTTLINRVQVLSLMFFNYYQPKLQNKKSSFSSSSNIIWNYITFTLNYMEHVHNWYIDKMIQG